MNSIKNKVTTKYMHLKLLTENPFESTLTSRPQTLHTTSESTGDMRAQNDTNDPGNATDGKGYFINWGIVSIKLSSASEISTLLSVWQDPCSVVTVHEYLPESKTNGSKIRSVNIPFP